MSITYKKENGHNIIEVMRDGYFVTWNENSKKHFKTKEEAEFFAHEIYKKVGSNLKINGMLYTDIL